MYMYMYMSMVKPLSHPLHLSYSNRTTMEAASKPEVATMEEGGAYIGDAPPGARLLIERMELTNFKSYAGLVQIGPFDRNMTSVVGPNGSGKSNVIDAMLFVFGFKANKCVPHPIAAVASRRNGAHGHA